MVLIRLAFLVVAASIAMVAAAPAADAWYIPYAACVGAPASTSCAVPIQGRTPELPPGPTLPPGPILPPGPTCLASPSLGGPGGVVCVVGLFGGS